MAFQCLEGAGKLFTSTCGDRTRASGFKLKQGRLRLDIRKNFFFFMRKGEALKQVAQRNCG